MSLTPRVRQLIAALKTLPGIGPKSAQRIALHLLERDRPAGGHLAQALLDAVEHVGYCRRCRSLSEDELCGLCRNPERNDQILCVVQSPVDVLAIEQAGYDGRFFVLGGLLSPLDGIGPEQVGIPELLVRVREEASELQEVILAVNSTVEGEATSHYLAQLLRDQGLAVTRIAHGIPLGGELELIDGGTLAHALAGRRSLI